MLKYRVLSNCPSGQSQGPGSDWVQFFDSGLGFGLRSWQYGESWTMSPPGVSENHPRQLMPLATRPGMLLVISTTPDCPMALAVKPLLEGKFGTTGVDVPMSKTYYEPLLEGLAKLGIRFKEADIAP